MGASTTSLAAAALLLASLATTAAMSIVSYGERSEEDMRRMYAEWMATHGRIYNAIGEDERRFEVFWDNLCYINGHNVATDVGVHSFCLGLNCFPDLANDEYRATYLGVRTRPQRERRLGDRYLAGDNGDLSESVDWRAKGIVAEVKDQGSCGTKTKWRMYLLLPARRGCLQETRSTGTPQVQLTLTNGCTKLEA